MPRRRSQKPRRRSPRRPTLQYRVVELSNVDEAALERTVNEQVRQGWQLDGVQFAMRESSKRPAMAFVFFTRPGPAVEVEPQPDEGRFREEAVAEQHLRRVVLGGEGTAQVATDAWTRLAQLAGGRDDGDEP